MVKLWSALRRAFLHAIGTLIAVLAAWLAWSAWYIFIAGNDPGPWGTWIYGYLSVVVSLLLGGGFLLMSFLFHALRGRIPRWQILLSSATLVAASFILLRYLPDAGPPLTTAFILLPVAASLWLIGSREKEQAPAAG